MIHEKIRKVLYDPRLRDVNVDSDELVYLHRTILHEKRSVREVFHDFYRTIVELDSRYFSASGRRLEVGAGATIFKETLPGLISSDYKFAGHLDIVADALALPIRDGSLRAIYAINCFHHLPDPDRFIRELIRTSAPGGGCILIEPFDGPVAEAVYRRLFASEGFDREQEEWRRESKALMSSANQALAHIVFDRDRAEFERKYPALEIVHQRPLDSWLEYLLSGGLNFRQLVPSWMFPLIRRSERIIAPLNRFVALHQTIVLRKRFIV